MTYNRNLIVGVVTVIVIIIVMFLFWVPNG
jgi:hypothetical protein